MDARMNYEHARDAADVASKAACQESARVRNDDLTVARKAKEAQLLHIVAGMAAKECADTAAEWNHHAEAAAMRMLQHWHMERGATNHG